jgi:hypothetical protein
MKEVPASLSRQVYTRYSRVSDGTLVLLLHHFRKVLVDIGNLKALRNKPTSPYYQARIHWSDPEKWRDGY